VRFTDLSEGSPYSWSWKFGSGNAEEGTSALQNPVWVFSSESTYTVALTVRRADGRSTRRRKITVSASSALSSAPTSGTRTVPVAGHVLGADGRTFITDVQIENPGDSAATAALTFQPASGEAPASVLVELGARETLNVTDAVLDLFGRSNAIGALHLQWNGGFRDGLRMTSRTYTRSGEGTLGQAAAGAARSEDQRRPRFVTGLARTDLHRTNLGAVNDSAEFQSFQILLRNRRGETLGASPVIGLAPGQQMQAALADLFPPASGKGMTAEFRPVGGSAAPLAYAAVVDNLSGDSTFYPAAPASSALYLPGVARITGYDGAFFSSDIAVANTGAAPAEIDLRFLEHDRDNSRSPVIRLILGPRETLQVDDVLGVLFHVSETYGALAIESDSSELAVAERIGTPSQSGPGTVGQQVDAIPDHGFFPRGSLLGLREDGRFRSNVGLFNPEPFPARVELVLRRPDGVPIGSTTYVVPPLGYVQRSVPALFPGADLPAGVALTLSIESGDVDVFAFAAVIDNVSQDPTFSPGLR
jgi:PKD domain